LAATPTRDAARRVRRLLGGQRDRVVVRHRWDQDSAQVCVPIPQLSSSTAGDGIQVMSVTAFRDYLACPYRFYLRHVLKLKPLDDATSELAANQFGDLVHGSLERFGESEDRNESRLAKIEAMLIEHLHSYAAQRYGDAVSTAVTLQIAQAERRLKAVAGIQAQRIAEGWTIYASEAAVDERGGAGIDVDGRRMGLRGRFDRIDHHAATGQWAILDYKTHGHRPEKKHLKKTDDGYRWIDLQLPLYRMMIPFLGIDADPRDVQLGYFNISEKADQTRINVAEFTAQQTQQAEQLVRDCIRRIWSGDFEPTEDPVLFDDYGMILQTGVASRLLDQAESMLGEGAEG
jgi:ATP-dependent helicase/DNAse subunit B